MNFKLYKLKISIKKRLVKFWYWLMKPIAYFFSSEKENARYEKKRSKITEQQAVKWIAEDIVRYTIKYNSKIDILICDYANEDYFWSDCTLSNKCPYYLKRDKTRMAYYKFNIDIPFQEKVVDEIKRINSVKVDEEVEELKWGRIDNYLKTVTIKAI